MIKVKIRCFGFSLFSPRFSSKEPYLFINSAILNHKTKEDEEASSFKLTTDQGLHVGGSVVASVSPFSGSSFFSTGMVT